MTATKTDPIPGLPEPAEATPRFAWPLPPDPTACGLTRKLLINACQVLPMPGHNADDLVAMGSELAANAVEHAPGPYEVRLYRSAKLLVCEVINGGDQTFPLPARSAREWTVAEIDAARTPEELERGRGLRTVTLLSQGRCGIRLITLECDGRSTRGVAAWCAVAAAPSR